MVDRDLPTHDEIYNGLGSVLDLKTAVKHYLGVSLSDAEIQFRGGDFNYLEDLYYMGPQAFQYYLRALVNYLEAPESVGDDMSWSFFQRLTKVRASELEPDFGLPTAVEGLKYILVNETKFTPDNEIDYTHDPRDLLKLLGETGEF